MLRRSEISMPEHLSHMLPEPSPLSVHLSLALHLSRAAPDLFIPIRSVWAPSRSGSLNKIKPPIAFYDLFIFPLHRSFSVQAKLLEAIASGEKLTSLLVGDHSDDT